MNGEVADIFSHEGHEETRRGELQKFSATKVTKKHLEMSLEVFLSLDFDNFDIFGRAEMEQDKLIFREEVYTIIGAAIEVHRELGHGFLEAVYEEAMAIESARRKIPFEIQVPLPVYYKGQLLKKAYVADYIGFGKIIVEFKSISKLTNYDQAQIIHYLKVTGIRLGLLINFGSEEKLEWARFVN